MWRTIHGSRSIGPRACRGVGVMLIERARLLDHYFSIIYLLFSWHGGSLDRSVFCVFPFLEIDNTCTSAIRIQTKGCYISVLGSCHTRSMHNNVPMRKRISRTRPWHGVLTGPDSCVQSVSFVPASYPFFIFPSRVSQFLSLSSLF